MKNVIHKLLSIVMAVVVLLSTMSFTVDMHYCGDTMVDFAFFKEAKACNMETLSSETADKNANVAQKSCCSDKQLVVEGQDDLKNSFEKVLLKYYFFVIPFITAYYNLFDQYFISSRYTTYDPPSIRNSVQLFYQVFLI